MGIEMLIYTTFGILGSVTNINTLPIGAVLGFVYATWSIGKFFDSNKKINYLKGLFAYILGMIIFYSLAIILGLGIDLITKFY